MKRVDTFPTHQQGITPPQPAKSLSREERQEAKRLSEEANFSFSGYFCACGKSGISFLHNIIAITLVRIPGVYLTSTLFPDTLFPMGLATAAGSLLSAIICVVAFTILNRKERQK